MAAGARVSTFVKICGVCEPKDVELCLALSVDAIGVNLVRSSPRCAPDPLAVARAVGEQATLVWVIDAAPPSELQEWLGLLDLVQRCDPAWPWPDWIAPEQRVEVVRLQSAADLLATITGPFVISDHAKGLGGSGKRADWSLTRQLAAKRRVLLAGGLTADNVREAVRAVSPFGVDVASGVERAPGVKDHALIRRFVEEARAQ